MKSSIFLGIAGLISLGMTACQTTEQDPYYNQDGGYGQGGDYATSGQPGANPYGSTSGTTSGGSANGGAGAYGSNPYGNNPYSGGGYTAQAAIATIPVAVLTRAVALERITIHWRRIQRAPGSGSYLRKQLWWWRKLHRAAEVIISTASHDATARPFEAIAGCKWHHQSSDSIRDRPGARDSLIAVYKFVLVEAPSLKRGGVFFLGINC